MSTDVLIVVVAYNDAPTLARCVRSLRDHIGDDIVIVDNHSDDDTPAVVDGLVGDLNGISAVRTERNAGYAGAIRAVEHVPTVSYLCIMNADCVTTGDWVTPLRDHLAATDGAGAASPTVALTGGDRLNAEGLVIHVSGVGFNRHLGVPVSEAASQPSEVPGIQGTAFMVATDALDDVGGWYVGGFLYHEDVELSWALRLAGYSTWHVPTPVVIHDYALTMSPEKLFLLERNRVEMLLADLRFTTLIALSPMLFAVEAAVWVYAMSKGRGLVEAKARSYRSLIGRRTIRRARRVQVSAFRRISDRALLASATMRYPREQTAVLRTGSPSSGRRGGRHMPTG